jgi:hypothetical protein
MPSAPWPTCLTEARLKLQYQRKLAEGFDCSISFICRRSFRAENDILLHGVFMDRKWMGAYLYLIAMAFDFG